MEDPVVPLERNLYAHPLAGTNMGQAIRERSCGTQLEKSSKFECLFVNREKGLSLSVYLDDINLAGKKQNIDPMLIVFVKDVDLGEPTSCHDHVYLGYTQRDSQTSKGIVDNNRNMFESKISAGAQELLRYSEKLCANISSWSYDMEGHAGKCTNSRKNKWDLTEKCLYLARIGRSVFYGP